MQIAGLGEERRRTAGRFGAGAASLAVHAALLAILVLAPRPAMEESSPVPIQVTLVEPPPPPLRPPEPPPSDAPSGPPEQSSAPSPAPTPPAPAPEPQPQPPARAIARPAPVPPKVVKPIPAPPAPQATYQLVSAAQMAGALTAGEGPGGGLAGAGAGSGQGQGAGGGGEDCSMVRRLEAALRRDRDVTAAVRAASSAADARGRALHVWDGDWVMTPGESGKGLAGVRQAIAMEVAFAPEACRRDPVRGLVLLSLADGPSAPRVALGAGTWRWADLLRP